MTARKKSNLGRQRQEQPVANPAAKLFKTKEADLFKLQTRIPRDIGVGLKVKAAQNDTTIQDLVLKPILDTYPDLKPADHD